MDGMTVLSKEDRIAARSKAISGILKQLPTLTPPVPGMVFDQESGGFRKDNHEPTILAKLTEIEAKVDLMTNLIIKLLDKQ